ncbi:ATP-binding protein [Streptomyces sp. DH24]|uniref:ATP-binding protein n=1 Tax=Streptomyces sp. DH24 TaxID=3040123 RepID=UPI0024430642|nr:ATP-binding protein [Streptomyces sp. DH24]MDG9715991.1 ATP-binding protein [Streptomyces sp. DH24]
MSHLRAPAGRADRREGGRHGRPVARTAPALPDAGIRPQLLRMAVLPPVAVALSGCAAVLFTVRSTGAGPSPTLWTVLAGAFSVTVAGIVIAAVAANRAAHFVHDRVADLRRGTARREAELRALVEQLRRGEKPPRQAPQARPPEDADDFELLAADLGRAHDGAVTAVVQAAQLSSQAGSEQKLEVFVNLARRLQSLVHREIATLDELENEIEDPDLLKGLFHVDHLATRIRRHAENLAVLGGAVSRRQWSNPVPMTEVLRSAIAEVEQYSRVRLVPPVDGELRGHAVADVIHLLAELVENATVFSAPHTQVLLRTGLVTSGLAVEVEDRGLGMPAEEQNRMNALLADPDQVNVAGLLADGRIGLHVVSQLARRHGITVRLQSNIYGGVQAVLVLPQALLGSAPGVPGAVPRTQPPGAHGQRYAAPDATGGAPLHTAPGASAVPGPPGVPRHGVPGAPPHHDGHNGHDGHDGHDAHDSRDVPPDSAPPHAPDVPHLPGTLTPAVTPAAAPLPPRRRTARHAAAPGGPPPLPVRGAHHERPTPAEAVPGVRPDDRRVLAEHEGVPPLPRAGTVRGTMAKPQLPRRRAQEHLGPQLRDGPVPRQDDDNAPGHDPGLMAAFQRGIGLAEAQQHLDTGAYGTGPDRTATVRPEPFREEPAPPAAPTGTTTLAVRPAGTARPAGDHHAHGPRDDGGPTARPDHTARHDGSAPAG